MGYYRTVYQFFIVGIAWLVCLFLISCDVKPVEQPKPEVKPVEQSKPEVKPVEQPKPEDQDGKQGRSKAPTEVEQTVRCALCGVAIDKKSSILSIDTDADTEKTYCMACWSNLNKAQTLNEQGAELFSEGNVMEAEKLFVMAIKLNPNLATAYSNLGHVFQIRGMYAEAITWLEKALVLDPHLEGVLDALNFCRTAAQKKESQPTQEKIAQYYRHGITFIGKESKIKTPPGRLGPIEFTYENYECSSVEKAEDFLNEYGAVEQNYYYVEVKTPKGVFGRDIDGIYKQ